MASESNAWISISWTSNMHESGWEWRIGLQGATGYLKSPGYYTRRRSAMLGLKRFLKKHGFAINMEVNNAAR